MFRIIVDNNLTIDVGVQRFPNGEAHIEFDEWEVGNIKNAAALRIEWLYGTDADIFTLQLLRMKLKDIAPAVDVTLYVPYMPYARMDRIMHPGQFESSRYFTTLLVDMDFSTILTYDLHSNRAISQVTGSSFIEDLAGPHELVQSIEAYRDDIVLVFPDESAADRYGNTIRPNITVKKTRDFDSGVITGFDVLIPDEIDLDGKTLVIVDDICSFGGTFVGAYNVIKEHAMDRKETLKGFILCVTHLEPVYDKGQLVKHPDLERIICRCTMDWQSRMGAPGDILNIKIDH